MGLAEDLGIDPTNPATWPSHCPKCRAELTKARQCMRHKREGGHCLRSAAPGTVVCVKHGAKAGQVQAKAKERVERAKAEEQLARLHVEPKDIDPHGALLGTLCSVAGWVDVLEGLVSRDGEDGLTQWGMSGRTESAYWSMLVEQRKLLLATARACHSAGIEERQVRLAEDQGRLIAEVVRTIVTGLGRQLDDPEVRQVVEPALRLVRPAA